MQSFALTSHKPSVFAAALAAVFVMGLGACGHDAEHPDAGAPPPDLPQTGSIASKLKLSYVCGNRYLVSNANDVSVVVIFKVRSTSEQGELTLPPAPTADPGYSETPFTTANAGTVDLYFGDTQVQSVANGDVACQAPPPPPPPPPPPQASTGEWTPPFSWPVVGLHLHLLPDGKVLSWGAAGDPYIWDPASGIFSPAVSADELFCSGHAFQPDGRLFVAGGHISNFKGLPDANLFDSQTQTWTDGPPMRQGRWYPTATTLANGEVLVLAGTDETGKNVGIPEVWTGSGWRSLTDATLLLPYYPRTFVAPNGKVFYAGEEQATRYLDPAGSGSWSFVAYRQFGVRDYGAAVMYEPGKVIFVGGGRTTNTAEIIDLNQPSPTWSYTGSMAYARRHLNATVLPTGEVLVTGGTSSPGFNDPTGAVHVAEVWEPSTGQWTSLAANTVTRVYHSATILLPDGRLLHTGSGDYGGVDEYNAEIFSPPYLFKGSRPSISSAPAIVGYGQTFFVGTAQAASIRKVTWIRLGSATHAFDMNQRLSDLSFSLNPTGINVEAPASPNLAPPGHYMLFVVDSNGVPSVAKIIRIG